MFLISQQPQKTGDIAISKDRFLIGRNRHEVDGTVGGNPMVGRIHCQVEYTDSGYTIRDLESRNGTKLNGEPILPGTDYPLQNGDMVSLAGTEYAVLLKYI